MYGMGISAQHLPKSPVEEKRMVGNIARATPFLLQMVGRMSRWVVYPGGPYAQIFCVKLSERCCGKDMDLQFAKFSSRQ